MIVWPRPVAGNDFACAMQRVAMLPLRFGQDCRIWKADEAILLSSPEQDFRGIGKVAPWLKDKPTPLAFAANETM